MIPLEPDVTPSLNRSGSLHLLIIDQNKDQRAIFSIMLMVYLVARYF